ncbi:hypothetical protein KVV02_005409 [Mortierella alpina]|uniref:Uncharacterized protein n=1 Tax=Mortierella alpina TaxID=64518 RepID=A0A9P8A5C0_MORAP|nr:hypothetical protein KVV02_005409 [Mortierella alpina]
MRGSFEVYVLPIKPIRVKRQQHQKEYANFLNIADNCVTPLMDVVVCFEDDLGFYSENSDGFKNDPRNPHFTGKKEEKH